ncbi:MAG: hypothetical protein IJG33_00605 [Selenomonadaceae bacterium]|nr:hypothetical protein [Selenomonadaceae bacterium]
MDIHDIFIDDDMMWGNVVRETDEWFKIQYELLKKMPKESFPSELDYEGLMDYLEGLVKQNQEVVEERIIRLVSNVFLVVSGKGSFDYRSGEMIDDLTDIYETVEKDPKLIDVINLEELVELGRKDALHLGAKCEDIPLKLSFKLLLDPRIMPASLIKETTGVEVDYWSDRILQLVLEMSAISKQLDEAIMYKELEEETIIDEEFLTEKAVRSRTDKIMKVVTDEQLNRFGMDREDFREMLISFGESFGKLCKKLDMKKIE